MKKIFCILLCICMLVSLAACGGEKPFDEHGSGDTKNADEAFVTVKMTVSGSKDGYPAVVKDADPHFFAYDENGDLYRIVWNRLDDIREGETVYVTYFNDGIIKQLNYDKTSDAKGFFAQYEFEPKTVWSEAMWKWKEISDKALREKHAITDLSHYLVSYDVGADGYILTYTLYIGKYRTEESYRITVNQKEEIVHFFGEYGEYAKYLKNATPEAIKSAEAKMKERLAEYSENTGCYLYVDKEGYLCLQAEVIIHLEPDDPKYGKVGCGDHDHRMFTERICKA